MIGISVGKLDKGEILKKDGYIPEDVNIGFQKCYCNFIDFPLQKIYSERKI